MTIEELLSLRKKQSNIEEFFALLFNQNIHPAFLDYSELPIDFSRISNLELWQIESGEDFYFVLYYCKQPFLIFEMDLNTLDVRNVFCINREIYRESVIYLSDNLGLQYVPLKERNSRIK